MAIEAGALRKFSRIRYEGWAGLEFVSADYQQCRIENLGAAGMFAAGTFHHHQGETCHVGLASSESAMDVKLHALAKVVRKNDRGIALQFTAMTFETYLFLQAILLNEGKGILMNTDRVPDSCPVELTEDLT